MSRELEALARRFRRAIEATPKTMLPIGFESFPTGSCGNTCLVLGKWLKDNGVDGFEYVCGEKMLGEYRSQTHAWLERKGLVVDITADQFGDAMPAVYVGAIYSFYHAFGVESRNHATFERYDDYTKASLASAYQAITAHLPP